MKPEKKEDAHGIFFFGHFSPYYANGRDRVDMFPRSRWYTALFRHSRILNSIFARLLAA